MVVLCEMLLQHGLMSSAMSAPRIRTSETLGQSRARELNHLAMGLAPITYFLKIRKTSQLGSCDEIMLTAHKEFLKPIIPGY